MIEQLGEWNYLNNLANEYKSFIKTSHPLQKNKDEIVSIFSYENKANKCKIDSFFDYKTLDYMLHCHMGFHLFHDIRFISKELSEYEEKMELYLKPLLEDLDPNVKRTSDFFIKRKGLDQWTPETLPAEIGNLKLYLQPPCYFSTINGAIVLLDYSDFENENQFALFYNRMRDDFYGERRSAGQIHRMPEFDCDSLEELTKILKELPSLVEKNI